MLCKPCSASVFIGLLSLVVGVTISLVVHSLIPPAIASQISQKTTAPFSIHSLEIGGISAGSSETEVKQLLGSPQDSKLEYWECCGNVKFLQYEKTKVGLIEAETPELFHVFSFATQRTDLATAAGIRVGDPQAKVIALYGEGDRSQVAELEFITYRLEEYAASLTFSIKDGKVFEIAFDEQLT
jgi:hypothetical protein